MPRKKQIISGMLVICFFLCILSAAFFAAEFILQTPALQQYISSFGYIGAVGVAMVAGLNVVLPLPVATFTPLFTAAGLTLPGLVVAFTIGTVLADFIGHLFGRVSREAVLSNYPKVVSSMERIYLDHHHLLIPIIFLYAAFVPFPNEAMVIPLALLGVRWRVMVLPLILGNLINQTIYAYGIHSVFQWLF